MKEILVLLVFQAFIIYTPVCYTLLSMPRRAPAALSAPTADPPTPANPELEFLEKSKLKIKNFTNRHVDHKMCALLTYHPTVTAFG